MYRCRTSSTSNCRRFPLPVPSGPLPRYLVTAHLYRRITDVSHPHPDHSRGIPLSNNFTVKLPTFSISVLTSTEMARYRTRLSSNYRCFHYFIALAAYFRVCRHITVVLSRMQTKYREYRCSRSPSNYHFYRRFPSLPPVLVTSRPVPRLSFPTKFTIK